MKGILLTLGASMVLVSLLSPATAAGRPATLTVTRDETCFHPQMTDHMLSTDTVSFDLPEIDGPVSPQGSYSLTGTGYSLAGASAYTGQVIGDEKLVLTFGHWNYNGEWVNSSPPEMPGAGGPVEIPLEPGAERRIEWQNAHADIVPCSGWAVYRLDFKRETELWEVALTGSRRVLHHRTYIVTDPQTGAAGPVRYDHGFTFRYRLTAQVKLVKRRGVWAWDSAQVTAADATASYEQSAPLYTILSETCSGCAKVNALAGKPLGGELTGRTIRLFWPNLLPEAEVTSRFAAKCVPGPHFETCENARKGSSGYAIDDADFLQRAQGHVLQLSTTPQSFEVDNDTTKARLTVRHDYRLRKLN